METIAGVLLLLFFYLYLKSNGMTVDESYEMVPIRPKKWDSKKGRYKTEEEMDREEQDKKEYIEKMEKTKQKKQSEPITLQDTKDLFRTIAEDVFFWTGKMKEWDPEKGRYKTDEEMGKKKNEDDEH